jgi:hypothetical protein
VEAKIRARAWAGRRVEDHDNCATLLGWTGLSSSSISGRNIARKIEKKKIKERMGYRIVEHCYSRGGRAMDRVPVGTNSMLLG